MMDIKLLLLLLFIIPFIIPSYADNTIINVSIPSEVYVGEEFSINISAYDANNNSIKGQAHILIKDPDGYAVVNFRTPIDGNMTYRHAFIKQGLHYVKISIDGEVREFEIFAIAFTLSTDNKYYAPLNKMLMYGTSVQNDRLLIDLILDDEIKATYITESDRFGRYNVTHRWLDSKDYPLGKYKIIAYSSKLGLSKDVSIELFKPSNSPLSIEFDVIPNIMPSNGYNSYNLLLLVNITQDNEPVEKAKISLISLYDTDGNRKASFDKELEYYKELKRWAIFETVNLDKGEYYFIAYLNYAGEIKPIISDKFKVVDVNEFINALNASKIETYFYRSKFATYLTEIRYNDTIISSEYHYILYEQGNRLNVTADYYIGDIFPAINYNTIINNDRFMPNAINLLPEVNNYFYPFIIPTGVSMNDTIVWHLTPYVNASIIGEDSIRFNGRYLDTLIVFEDIEHNLPQKRYQCEITFSEEWCEYRDVFYNNITAWFDKDTGHMIKLEMAYEKYYDGIGYVPLVLESNIVVTNLPLWFDNKEIIIEDKGEKIDYRLELYPILKEDAYTIANELSNLLNEGSIKEVNIEMTDYECGIMPDDMKTIYNYQTSIGSRITVELCKDSFIGMNYQSNNTKQFFKSLSSNGELVDEIDSIIQRFTNSSITLGCSELSWLVCNYNAIEINPILHLGQVIDNITIFPNVHASIDNINGRILGLSIDRLYDIGNITINIDDEEARDIFKNFIKDIFKLEPSISNPLLRMCNGHIYYTISANWNDPRYKFPYEFGVDAVNGNIIIAREPYGIYDRDANCVDINRDVIFKIYTKEKYSIDEDITLGIEVYNNGNSTLEYDRFVFAYELIKDNEVLYGRTLTFIPKDYKLASFMLEPSSKIMLNATIDRDRLYIWEGIYIGEGDYSIRVIMLTPNILPYEFGIKIE